MSNPYANYKVGLVMSRGGLNDAQRTVFRKRLQEIASMGGAEPDGLAMFVPAVASHGDSACGPASCEQTEALVARVTDRMDWVHTTILDVGPIPTLVSILRECDEVWCATATGQSEFSLRPMRVYRAAQSLSTAWTKFKLLHYWVEVPPESLPTQDRKKPKALKGW